MTGTPGLAICESKKPTMRDSVYCFEGPLTSVGKDFGAGICFPMSAYVTPAM